LSLQNGSMDSVYQEWVLKNFAYLYPGLRVSVKHEREEISSSLRDEIGERQLCGPYLLEQHRLVGAVEREATTDHGIKKSTQAPNIDLKTVRMMIDDLRGYRERRTAPFG